MSVAQLFSVIVVVFGYVVVVVVVVKAACDVKNRDKEITSAMQLFLLVALSSVIHWKHTKSQQRNIFFNFTCD